MPGGDRTGPVGMGPMTGRAAGYCAGFAAPGYANPSAGQGRGVGLGRGRGFAGRGFGGGGRRWRNMFYATGLPGWARFGGIGASPGYVTPYSSPDPKLEKQALQDQADALQAGLDSIRKRLAEIEADTAAE